MTAEGGGLPRRIVATIFASIPPRLFRFVRLAPVLGDAMLAAVDATFGPQARLRKKIRSGPLMGMVVDVDPRAMDMVIGRYEPAIQALLETTLVRGDVAFDIGANLGYFTLVMAKQVAPGGRVVSFEPDPEVLSVLTDNVNRNVEDSDAVTVVATAVGADAGTAKFASGWRSTRGRIVSDGGDFEVEVMTVDDAAARFGAPRLMKIDVEGAELDVLRGAEDVLRSARPVVLVEVHSPELEQRCTDLLESLGYQCDRRGDRGKKETYLVAT
ncbi:MAG: FkbM family methyltransferase [Actinomycetota bacterium]|nr:FkbM family methyltransferase [Actinomycetota bacterium]